MIRFRIRKSYFDLIIDLPWQKSPSKTAALSFASWFRSWESGSWVCSWVVWDFLTFGFVWPNLIILTIRSCLTMQEAWMRWSSWGSNSQVARSAQALPSASWSWNSDASFGSHSWLRLPFVVALKFKCL